MNTMYDQLLYIRRLLLAMDNLNTEESNLRSQIQQPKQIQTKVEQKKRKLPHPAIIFCVLMLLSMLSIGTKYKEQMNGYENDAFNDKWAWEMNHADDNAPYPGYEGEKPTYIGTAFSVILFNLPWCVGCTVAYGVVRSGLLRSDKKRNENQNRQIENRNTQTRTSNKLALQRNAELKAEIEHLHERKILVSQQYMQYTEQCQFPRKFGYLSAVEYFIELVENHLVDNYREAVKMYLEEMRHQESEASKAYYAGIIINNQNIMISKQEALVRQQMVGNMINMANLVTNMSTNAEVSRMANAAERTADSAARTAGKVEQVYNRFF